MYFVTATLVAERDVPLAMVFRRPTAPAQADALSMSFGSKVFKPERGWVSSPIRNLS